MEKERIEEIAESFNIHPNIARTRKILMETGSAGHIPLGVALMKFKDRTISEEELFLAGMAWGMRYVESRMS